MCLVLGRLISATKYLGAELQKSKILLIDNTLLVVKSKNTYWSTVKKLKGATKFYALLFCGQYFI